MNINYMINKLLPKEPQNPLSHNHFFFSENWADFSEDQGKKFHHDIKWMEKLYQEKVK